MTRLPWQFGWHVMEGWMDVKDEIRGQGGREKHAMDRALSESERRAFAYDSLMRVVAPVYNINTPINARCSSRLLMSTPSRP